MKKPYISFLLLMALFVSFNAVALPVLNSLPSATATIYLDFDGHHVDCAYWNSGIPFTCDPSGMTDAQVTEVFNRVAEDYRPFDINITTDEAIFIAAPLSSRIRVVVTPTSGWFTGVGGVSYIGSFNWGDDTPAFVFCDRLGPKNAKMVAECCSHESGHSVGLSHQSKYDGTCNLTATYNEGEGSGEASWAPIMGNSYYRNMSGWNNGPTPYGCANTQDNLSIITSQNGFTYRRDDYSDDINNNPTAFTVSGAVVSGIISTNTDKDAFSFTLVQNSIVHLHIKPFSVDANDQGANLDVKMSLYNSSKVLIRTYDPSAAMDVLADTVLDKGTYYLLIDGTGNSNVNDYGSLGSYSINSSAGGILPIHQVALVGIVNQNIHKLSWTIQSGDAIKSISVESSTDDIHFNTVKTFSELFNNFSYTPSQTTDLYYRVKVNTILNQAIYSNTLLLKGVGNALKTFAVSSFIQNEIVVTATVKYQYLINDVNGNAVTKGYGHTGSNKIDMGQLPAGMYVLQILSNTRQQTNRIIKQ